MVPIRIVQNTLDVLKSRGLVATAVVHRTRREQEEDDESGC